MNLEFEDAYTAFIFGIIFITLLIFIRNLILDIFTTYKNLKEAPHIYIWKSDFKFSTLFYLNKLFFKINHIFKEISLILILIITSIFISKIWETLIWLLSYMLIFTLLFYTVSWILFRFFTMILELFKILIKILKKSYKSLSYYFPSSLRESYRNLRRLRNNNFSKIIYSSVSPIILITCLIILVLIKFFI